MAINKASITDQIYNLIKDKILLQELEVGTQIDTKKIARENNISVMPVRDALKKLENHGLVERRSRVGFFVRTFSRKEIKEIMEARKMYEVYSLEEHFESIDKEAIKNIYWNLKEKDSLSREEFDGIDNKFHDILLTATNNDYLIDNYDQLKDIIILFRHLDKDRIEKATCEHRCLMESIINNQQQKAKELLKTHIDNVTCSILQNI